MNTLRPRLPRPRGADVSRLVYAALARRFRDPEVIEDRASALLDGLRTRSEARFALWLAKREVCDA